MMRGGAKGSAAGRGVWRREKKKKKMETTSEDGLSKLDVPQRYEEKNIEGMLFRSKVQKQ